MGRRRREEGDSLGLLLDPICNTFGGIIFLAMIISLLSHRQLHRAAPQPDSTAKLEALDARRRRDRLATELAEADAQADVARHTLTGMWGTDDVARIQSSRDTPAAPDGGRAVEVLTRLAAERNAADRQADALHADRADTEQAAARAVEQNRQAAAALAAVRAAVAADRVAARGSVDHAVRLRTPLSHATSKRQVPLLLAHGRVYVPFQYDSDGRVGDPTGDCGPKLNNREAVLGPDDLDKARGVDMSDPAAADRWVDAFVAKFTTDEAYIAAAVWPDAHDAFTRLRDRLVSRGFDYQLLIEDTDDHIVFGGHADHHVQ